ncbi:MAG: baseplate hub protein [Vibrio sp.]
MSSGEFWGREVRILAGEEGKQVPVITEEMSVEIVIRKSLKKDPNRSEMKIFGLTESTSAQITNVNSRVIIQAGYRDQGGAVTCFTGNVLQGVRYSTNDCVATEVEMGDGYIPMRDTLVSVSYPKDIAAKTVLADISRQMGLVLRKMPDVQEKNYPTGFAYMGQSFRALDKITAYLGAEWSIQNNELQIIKKGGTAKKYAVVLRSDSGMIGSPELNVRTFSEKRAIEQGLQKGEKVIIIEREPTKTGKSADQYRLYGYNVSCYLLPDLEPGDLVRLEAKSVQGWFRVEELEHNIKSQGHEFRTDMKVTAVNNG